MAYRWLVLTTFDPMTAAKRIAEAILQDVAHVMRADETAGDRMMGNILDMRDLEPDAFLECLNRLDSHPEALTAIGLVLSGLTSPDGGLSIEEEERLSDIELKTASLSSPDLMEWISESWGAMDSFTAELDCAHVMALAIYTSAPRRITGSLAICFTAERDELVIWQRRDFELQSLAPLVFSEWVYEFDQLLVFAGTSPRAQLRGPLFRFHPMRFQQSRYYSEDAAQFCFGGSLPSFEELQSLMGLVIDEMNDRRSEVDRRDTLDRHVHHMMLIDAEESIALAWVKFVGAGRQIFEASPVMVDMLRHTDIEDVPVNLLRLPYPTLYLHFGAQDDLELEPGWKIDGAYVEHHPEHQLLIFTFTARPHNDADVSKWHAFGEPVISISLPPEVAGYDLGTAIDQQIADRMNRLRSERAAGDRDATQEFAEIAAEEGVLLPLQSVQITTGSRATAQIEQEERRLPILRTAMRLAVNVLCYLTAYPDDVETTWPDGTPQWLRRQVINGTLKERTRARSKLESLGFTAINLCGRHLAAPPSHDDKIHGDKLPRTHWRRGHWRRQAYGQGLQSRRIIWIMPTMVGTHALAADPANAPGHIYKASL